MGRAASSAAPPARPLNVVCLSPVAFSQEARFNPTAALWSSVRFYRFFPAAKPESLLCFGKSWAWQGESLSLSLFRFFK